MASGWFKNITRHNELSYHGMAEDSLEPRGRQFWQKGYDEIKGCSGSGKGWCSYQFLDAYGNTLEVLTVPVRGGWEDHKTENPRLQKIWSWSIKTPAQLEAEERRYNEYFQQ